jgi:ferredoxin-type protein NapH
LAAVFGVAVVAGFYFFVGGRSYCAWVCPVNPITDLAAWLREKLPIKQHMRLDRRLRMWVVLAVLLVTLLSGGVVYEYVNPVSHAYRLVIFASLGSVWFVAGVFLFDLLVSRRGWCGHVCPMGVVYAQLGKLSPLKIAALDRQQCDDCMDCYKVCPEPQVIKPALKGEAKGMSPVILDSDCTLCARCIDVCDKHVFSFSSRFAHQAEKSL